MGAETLQIVRCSLGGLSIVVNALPIPDPFKSAVVGIPDAVLQIIAILETARGNMEDAVALIVYIATVTDKTIRPLDPINASPAARKRIEEFLGVLLQIKQGIREIASQKSRWRRIVNYDRDASTITAMKQSVADAISCIQASLRLELETAVATNEEIELIRQKQDVIYEDQQRIIRQQQEAEISRLVASLGTQASGASKKPPCLDGTRVSLLDRIDQWIGARSDNGPRALCLKGSAGIGKSSIGATVAGEQRASHRLGAEFYFTADQQDRNEAVVVVLARQLAAWSKGRLRFEIADAIDEDAEIMRSTPELQYQKLIQGPLQTLAGDPSSPTLVVLLDGLDECNEDYACRLLKAVGQGLDKLPVAVRVILTSRPDPHLLNFYTSEPMRTQLDIFSLDSEEVLQQKRDIWKFFKEELPGMVKMWVKESSDWPGDERRTMLVELSQGLWIHASTVARMLADSAIRNPEKQLEAVLSSHGDANGEYGHNTHLDKVYSAVLNRACPPHSTPNLLALFRNVLGTILVVQEPVNIHTLASLLCPRELKLEDYTHSIRTTVLAYLQAVLIVPGVDDANPSHNALPIRFIHKSFEDHIADGFRCDTRFLINTAHFNRVITIRCLTCPSLERNICKLDPSKLNSEIDDLHNRIQESVPAELQYACAQWPKHVSREPPGDDGIQVLLDRFAHIHLLHWVEVVSLLGKAEEAIGLVDLVVSWLQAKPIIKSSELAELADASTSGISHHHVHSNGKMLPVNIYRRLASYATSYSTIIYTDNHRHNMAMTLESFEQPSPKATPLSPEPSAPTEPHTPITTLLLLQELKCFVHEFMVPISTSSSHIYISALLFTPAHSPLFHIYGHMLEGRLSVRRGRLQRWSTPDDHGVRIEADEDPPVLSHANDVGCVAWSPNGKTIVSGSHDHTVRRWDASTGKPIGEALKGHTGPVWDVAWSPDGKTFVSASWDHTLRLWDASAGQLVGEPFKGHTKAVHSVAWSPDGNKIVSGSEDGTVQLWTASTQAPIETLWKKQHKAVLSVAWSPNGYSIALGCSDGVVRLFAASSAELIGEMTTDQDDSVWHVAWSHDSQMIVSACQDETIHIWDVLSNERIGKVLRGHANPVKCVAWSPNGKTIVSGSWGDSLLLWDVSTQAPIGEPLHGHTSSVYSVAWSPDGKTIVSGSRDRSLRFWDASTGEPIRFGQRWPDSHTHSVYRIAFSSDTQYIASASADGTVRVWDVKTGALAQRPANQPLQVSSLGFSVDGNYVIAEDGEVQTIWDIAGGGHELAVGPPVRSAEDPMSVLTIDMGGWLLDAGGKRMFWIPVVLRPVKKWGRVLVKGNILTMETPTVPIIDISAFVSKGS
ncbi:hypothetical protein FRB96_009552 [Tulasnella sp. 330]|nr:hypothetical protein FRB96_009552 [Tulasnella sp. 330]